MRKGNLLLRKAHTEMKKEPANLEMAFNYLSKSAQENNHEAMYAIGTWYLHGRFVKKNYPLAIEYFLKAAMGDNSDAYFDLAVCYEKGTIGKKNFKAAFECFLRAALLGDKQALFEVGRCYYYGIGIPKNVNIGNVWLKHAEKNGIVNR